MNHVSNKSYVFNDEKKKQKEQFTTFKD